MSVFWRARLAQGRCNSFGSSALASVSCGEGRSRKRRKSDQTVRESSRRLLDFYNSQNLNQIEKLRNISSYSYMEGAVSLFELLDAQRTYNQALTAYNQARTDYQISLWQQSIGRPLR